jgi:hypothetical protein
VLKLRFAGPGAQAPDPLIDRPTGVHVWLNRQGGVVARGFREAGFHWMAWPDLVTYRFAPADPFITAYAVPGAPVDIIWDVYRRSVVPMALQAFGWEALHASAIVTSRGLIGFCATSETGKSTVAFGLRRRGFPQWSDDGVVFRTEGAALATPLPFEARLRPESRAIFGADAAMLPRLEGNGRGEQRYSDPMPIALICLLKRVSGADDAPPLIRNVPATEAFPELLIHAHEFDPYDPDRRARMMQTYLDLVALVPVVEIRFVPNRDRLETLLDTIVDKLSLGVPDEADATQSA